MEYFDQLITIMLFTALNSSRMDQVDPYYLYKYLPFNDGSLKIITESSLKFTSPLEFNDPFDSEPVFDQNFAEAYWKANSRALSPRLNMSPAKRIQDGPARIRRLQNQMDSGVFGRHLVSTVGIFCASRDPCIGLMWSHYADMHRGFVVELCLPSESVAERFTPFPVTYSAERPVMTFKKDEPDFQAYFLRKNLHWEYEQEERIFATKPDIFTYPSQVMLTGVIMGARMPPEQNQIISDAVHDAEKRLGSHIQLYQAQLSKTHYRVFIPGHSNPEFSNDQTP